MKQDNIPLCVDESFVITVLRLALFIVLIGSVLVLTYYVQKKNIESFNSDSYLKKHDLISTFPNPVYTDQMTIRTDLDVKGVSYKIRDTLYYSRLRKDVPYNIMFEKPGLVSKIYMHFESDRHKRHNSVKINLYYDNELKWSTNELVDIKDGIAMITPHKKTIIFHNPVS
jgi:hypothetical protein